MYRKHTHANTHAHKKQPVEMLQKKKDKKEKTRANKMPQRLADISLELFALCVSLSPEPSWIIHSFTCKIHTIPLCLRAKSPVTPPRDKLTQLTPAEFQIPQSAGFEEHHHYFIFSRMWTTQFGLITSRALMHYKRRNHCITFKGERDMLNQYS